MERNLFPNNTTVSLAFWSPFDTSGDSIASVMGLCIVVSSLRVSLIPVWGRTAVLITPTSEAMAQ